MKLHSKPYLLYFALRTLPNGNKFEYKVFSDEIKIPGTLDTVMLSIASAKVPSTIKISPKRWVIKYIIQCNQFILAIWSIIDNICKML